MFLGKLFLLRVSNKLALRKEQLQIVYTSAMMLMDAKANRDAYVCLCALVHVRIPVQIHVH